MTHAAMNLPKNRYANPAILIYPEVPAGAAAGVQRAGEWHAIIRVQIPELVSLRRLHAVCIRPQELPLLYSELVSGTPQWPAITLPK